MTQTHASTAETLYLAQVVPCTEAEGPGRRFALWFQGCPLRCPGCCNGEMLPFRAESARPLAEVRALLEASQREHKLEGITLLGGEPMAHAAGAVQLAQTAHRLGLTVLVFTGYTLAELHAQAVPDQLALLAETDLLIDGPFLRDQPERSRRWIGSANQSLHRLSERVPADDPRWKQRNTLEIRLRSGELTVNGFPSLEL